MQTQIELCNSEAQHLNGTQCQGWEVPRGAPEPTHAYMEIRLKVQHLFSKALLDSLVTIKAVLVYTG